MKYYKLLTPGPLTTTDTVKKEMLFDHCTWDDDYKKITQEIREKLLKLAHVSEDEYTVVLMQGSGTFGVESVLTSVIGKDDKLLICANCKPRRYSIHHLSRRLRQDSGCAPCSTDPRGSPGDHPCFHGTQRDHFRNFE